MADLTQPMADTPAPPRAQRRAPRRAPRTEPEVLQTSPHDLAMMTLRQVAAMRSDAARARRIQIITTDRTTKWTYDDIAAYHGVPKGTVQRWRWQYTRNIPGTRGLIDPIPGETRPQLGRGRDSPVWWMSDVINWSAGDGERTDQKTYVAFPDGRRRPGRTPDTDPFDATGAEILRVDELQLA